MRGEVLVFVACHNVMMGQNESPYCLRTITSAIELPWDSTTRDSKKYGDSKIKGKEDIKVEME